MVVLSGPSGVGKTTVVRRLRRTRPDIWISVSATTRPPRPGETDGQHYRFLDDAAFDALVEHDQLLEWAVVHGHHRYGTPREPVQAALTDGKSVLLEIDLQGARQVRQRLPDGLFVFLAPPSWEEMERRLTGRGTETPEQQTRRLQTAQEELAAEAEFDITLVNRDVETVCQELVTLLGHPESPSPEA